MKFFLVTILAALLCISFGNAAPSESSEIEESTFDTATELPKYFECVINSMGKALRSNGEDAIWNKYGPKMLRHLNTWKKCAKAADRDVCDSRESQATYSIMTRCIIKMSSLDPEVLQEFARISREKCDP